MFFKRCYSQRKMNEEVDVQSDLAVETKVKEKENVDLEDALDLAGHGKYQWFHSSLMLFTLLAAVLEMGGIAFVMPAATCDLQIPDNLKGILTSIPNIGVILTATLWGRAADTLGRKPVLIISSAMSGLLGLAAAFMPTLLGFALLKLAGSLFLSSPSSLSFAYACEIMPMKYRDITVLISNGLVMVLSTVIPAFAWLILPYSWRLEIGTLVFRPWRLLTVVYVMPLIIAAVFMLGMQESPKFLATRGKWQESLAVLRRVYAFNTGLAPEEYQVKSLKSSSDTVSEGSSDSNGELAPGPRKLTAMAMLKPPHVKWLALTSFLMFGIMSVLSGLFLFAPDILNRTLFGSEDEVGTVCVVLNPNGNSTDTGACVDDISHEAFQIMVISTLIFGVIVMAASMMPLSKKVVLVAMFVIVGAACLVSVLTTNMILAAVTMSCLQLLSLGIGPVMAYVVRFFPTSLRGTAVGAVLMFGRLGSAVGANVAGLLLAAACTATFYGFTALLFLCAALSFLLPGDNSRDEDSSSQL
ncbi:synaptic vesicle glycoprotein 2C-like [Manduca sexta]|uniref:synaptic vesicle glycoprotein 2C-like n=1 Tax=Manduca sexta TaxID=7130 RepID=UPI00188E61C7|nr:synaptic vesicle glycoprotein 2C-like [Manduca sexta]